MLSIGYNTTIWHKEKSNIYGDGWIGNNCNIGALVEIRYPRIGDGCKIQAFVFIPEGVVIGNNVFIGPHVCFTNDKYPTATGDWEHLQTIVEDDVSVGAGAVILPGLTLGKGCTVGAGAVVTKDVPAGVTVVGNPAKKLQKGCGCHVCTWE